MVERLTIGRLGHRGDGIAEDADGPIYVPGALPGETVETEPWPGYAERRRLTRIEKPSAQRIAPICPHFGECGGCAVQHWEKAPYRAWKRDLVVAALHQTGIDAPVGDLIDAHGEGRRRVVFHARRVGRGGTIVGFSAAREHRLVSINRCPILAQDLDGALTAALAIAEALSTEKPLDLQVTATEAGLDIDLRGFGPLTVPLRSALARVAAAHNLARLTHDGELIALERKPILRIGGAVVPLPPAAFLQATQRGEAALSQLVLSGCFGAKQVADLFCGIGPFALRLAEHARVFAVDNDEAAVVALKRAAATTSGLKPIEAELRDLFRNPLLTAELRRFDAVVFDPPRQGALAQARELAGSDVARILSLSCNPRTFARDASALIGGGYRLTEVTPVDQFRYSAHVEIVGRLER